MRSRLRSIARWAPAVVLGLLLVGLWAVMLSGGMRAVVAWVLLLSAGQILGPLTLLVVVVHAVRKRRMSAPMAITLGLSLFAIWPALWGFGVLAIPFPASLSTAAPAATVRLPSNEPLRIVWGGDRVAVNRHAIMPDQRWAYDIVIEPAMSGSPNLADYGCYGTPVVAPIRARVHAVTDGLPDETPGQLSVNVTSPLGNNVMLALDTGTFLVLAHLKPGSVLVKEGDEVEEGQPIGACGNSGNTSEPHIHIHHQRQDPKGRPVNFSEGLPLYFRDHDGAPMPEGGVSERDGKPVLTGAVVRHAQGR